MEIEAARKINAAACRLWFFQHGIKPSVDRESVDLLKSISSAQIQTATEVVEALNRNAAAADGKTTISCVLALNAVEPLKRFAETLET